MQAVKLSRMTTSQREQSKSTKVTRLGSQGDINQLMNDPGDDKRYSFMRRMTSQLTIQEEEEEPTVKAADLVPKLKLLYSAGVVSFMHHIQATACKTSEKQRHQNIGMLNERIQDQYHELVKNAILEDKLIKERRESEQIIKKKSQQKDQEPEPRKSLMLSQRSFSGMVSEETKP